MNALCAIFTAIAFIFVFVEANSDEELWEKFKNEYNKNYMSTEDEHRFNVFKDNLKTIKEHNRKFKNSEVSYKMGINKFADMTKEEFLKTHLAMSNDKRRIVKRNSPISCYDPINFENSTYPNSSDWRQKGAVTPVKNQGSCNAGWAFSTIGALEAQYFIGNGTLKELSVQQLLDCNNEIWGQQRCAGGSPLWAHIYLRDYGLAFETDYPYKGQNGTCKKDVNLAFKNITQVCRLSLSERLLTATVGINGPVATEVDASNFQHYEEGIFKDNKCGIFSTNHAVLLVGYGTDDYGNKYWIVKNSWGTDWGEDGYMRLSRGTNMCGIASDTVQPLLGDLTKN